MEYDDAPETIPSADGTTTLRRYHVEGIIYAPDRAHAQTRLDNSDLYLDVVRLVDENAIRPAYPFRFINDTGEVDNQTPHPKAH